MLADVGFLCMNLGKCIRGVFALLLIQIHEILSQHKAFLKFEEMKAQTAAISNPVDIYAQMVKAARQGP